MLPPIFPLLTGVFGVGYAELGLVASLMYVASGLMQTPAGILVDRLGPSRVLIGGVGLFSASVLLSGLVPSFWWLAPLAIIAGLGNAVFHPADYAIMTARVDPRRLGRAFGAHGVAGNLGWVAAPASVLGLTALFGWRAALVILGGAGLAFTAYLMSQHAVLGGETRTGPVARAARVEAGAGAGLRVLLAPSVLLCFAYFTLLSVAQVGLQTFFPSAAVAAFGVSIGAANAMLTGFLVAAALGVLAGGIVADRFPRHELVVGIGLAVAAGLSLDFRAGGAAGCGAGGLRQHRRVRDGCDDAGPRYARARRGAAGRNRKGLRLRLFRARSRRRDNAALARVAARLGHAADGFRRLGARLRGRDRQRRSRRPRAVGEAGGAGRGGAAVMPDICRRSPVRKARSEGGWTRCGEWWYC